MRSVDFVTCIRENLKGRRFGKERADEIISDYEARVEFYADQGRDPTSAATLAMKDTFDKISEGAIQKAKRTAKMLAVQGEIISDTKAAMNTNLDVFSVKDKAGNVVHKTSRGEAMVYSLMSRVEKNPLFPGRSYGSQKDVVRGQLWAIMNDVAEKAGKGVLGRQRGKAHLDNIAHEIMGKDTGDKAAKQMADAFTKMDDTAVELFNSVGGSLKKLDRYLPTPDMNMAKLHLNEAKWKATRNERWDWNRIRHEDGTLIKPSERKKFIDDIYNVRVTDGSIKIDPKAYRGRGKALGNALDNHRVIHYKDGQAWLDDLKEFGEGGPVDVISRHVEMMAHKIAMVDVWGPNPDMAADNAYNIIKKLIADEVKAGKLSNQELKKAEYLFEKSFKPMFDVRARHNPMDANSRLGNAAVGISNILRAVQLSAVALSSIPGDFINSRVIRGINGQKLFGGTATYLKAMTLDRKFAERIATQTGFIMDDVVSSMYATQRWTGPETYGPAISRRISDVAMRASVNAIHTRNLRFANQHEMMGALFAERGKSFDKFWLKNVMERYGITADDWNAVRKEMKAFEPGKGVKLFRPLDILDTGLKNKRQLYNKFQGMILEEARLMVPESTVEAAITLKGTTRPDTLHGLLLHSFAAYKNFPVTYALMHARLGLTRPSARGRVGYYAAVAAASVIAGSITLQLRELKNGRDFRPMTTEEGYPDPLFLTQAFMVGGGASIWGDFLYQAQARQGLDALGTLSGPLAEFAVRTTYMAGNAGYDGYMWANAMLGGDTEDWEPKIGAIATDYLRRYAVPSAVSTPVNRLLIENLEELADPNIYSKRQNRADKQSEIFGNDYWWPPGESSPVRGPEYNGRQ